jgi:hypothetical protein
VSYQLKKWPRCRSSFSIDARVCSARVHGAWERSIAQTSAARLAKAVRVRWSVTYDEPTTPRDVPEIVRRYVVSRVRRKFRSSARFYGRSAPRIGAAGDPTMTSAIKRSADKPRDRRRQQPHRQKWQNIIGQYRTLNADQRKGRQPALVRLHRHVYAIIKPLAVLRSVTGCPPAAGAYGRRTYAR